MSSFSVSVLRLRDFRLLLLTRVFAMMALQAQDVIVGWQIYSLTRDPFMLGLAGLVEAVPAIACALFAGHIVDVSRPHRVFLLCIGALSLTALALLLLAGGIVPMPAHTIIPILFACIFLSGLMRSFIMPSSFALLSKIIQRPDLPAASAWMSSGYQIAAISGPAVAGIVYGGYGVMVAWLLPVSLMVMAFVTLASMSHPPRHHRSGEKREPALKSIRAGWRFMLGNSVLLSVMTLDMFAVLFGGAVAMLPAYADQVLHVGSQGLGALRAATAIGAIVVALMLALRPLKVIRATILLWVIVGFGMSIIGFGLSTSFWVSFLFLAISGGFDSVSMVVRGTLMQILTPDNMRGRVSAVNSMFIISSNEIGAFESGVMAKLLGLVPSVVVGGVGTLLVAALTALLSPKLRRTVVHTEMGRP